MVLRGLGALFRAAIVCMMIYYPSFALADFDSRSGLDISLLFSLISSIVILIEYVSRTPSMIEFSMAPPYNRYRISVLTLVMVFLVTTINPTNSTGPIFDVVDAVSNAAVFILGLESEPVARLLNAFGSMSEPQRALIAELATGALFVAVITVIILSTLLWLQKWPLGQDGFNLWPNMPSFHARAGHKTETRMIQVALLSLVVTITFPFVLPQIVWLARVGTGVDFASNRLSVFWIIVLWSMVPAMAMMRSLALLKVAFLIDHLRKL